MSKSLTVDNSTIKFQIWDTAGQERVSSYNIIITVSFSLSLSLSLFPPLPPLSIVLYYQCTIEMLLLLL